MTNTTRRAILAGIATVPAVSVPALAASSDDVVSRFIDAAAQLSPSDCQRVRGLLRDTDMAAAVALDRFRLVLDALRRYSIAPGWSVDEIGAKLAQTYFEDRAAGRIDDNQPIDASACDDAMGFLHQHGQSIDYVFLGDVPSMVVGLASKSPRAIECADASHPSDPIYAAIARHKAALRASEAAVEISSALRDDDPRHAAASAVTSDAEDALDAAGLALATTATTLPGLVAMLGYVLKLTAGDDFHGGNWTLPYLVSEDDGGEPAPIHGMLDDDEERDEHFMRYLLRSLAATLEKIGGQA